MIQPESVTEDDRVEAALAEIEALPFCVTRQCALAIAAVAVSEDGSAERTVKNILEEWAENKVLGWKIAAKALAEAREAAPEINQRGIERRAMTPSLRLAVFQRDGHMCVSCGARAPDAKLHADHMLPISKGGKTELENLQTLCESCNLAKAAKIVEFPDSTGNAGTSRRGSR